MSKSLQNSDFDWKNPKELLSNIQKIREQMESKFKIFDQMKQLLYYVSLAAKIHQEQQFMKSFQIILQKMGEELLNARKKYIDINQQLQKQQKIVRYKKQLYFFRQQCLNLSQQLQKKKYLISKIQQSNEELKREIEILKITLERNVSKNKRLRIKLIENCDINKSVVSKNLQEKSEQKKVKIIYTPYHHKGFQQNKAKSLNFDQNDNTSEKSKNQNSRVKINKFFKKYRQQNQTVNKFAIMQKFAFSNEENELLLLWQECVQQWRKRFNLHTQEPKRKLLEFFFTSSKFLEIIRRKIFNIKCCNNWNCTNNTDNLNKKQLLMMQDQLNNDRKQDTIQITEKYTSRIKNKKKVNATRYQINNTYF